MRRQYLAILVAFPLANALSLANFQQITSILIPLACQLTYDTQIPTCTTADFQNGCSIACIAALQSVAQSVTDSCAGVTVSSSTLLGIIENGGIVAALCPTLSTSTAHTTTKPASMSSNTQATTVTIPTDSQGVTGGLGLQTTSTSVIAKTTSTSTTSTTSSSVKSTRSSSVVSVTVTSASTTTSTSIASLSESSTSDSSTTSTTSTDDRKTSTTTSTTSSKKGSVAASTSSKSTATPTANSGGNSDNGSGGGSPFDIQSSGNRIRGESILGLVIFAMAYNLIGR